MVNPELSESINEHKGLVKSYMGDRDLVEGEEFALFKMGTYLLQDDKDNLFLIEVL